MLKRQTTADASVSAPPILTTHHGASSTADVSDRFFFVLVPP